ncbi:hypothetical protein LWI29_014093 [Acer saccharum]|uniref:Uncharacterized protein n=1 Tax=Acer saccharum TaxID=4024 RepID=A0AA39SIP4_ACESA|nr:hypothetical protein LWI29_014093 [Acer saccharum]
MRAPGLDRLNSRIKSPVDSRSKNLSTEGNGIVPQISRLGAVRSEVNNGGLQGGSFGSVKFQVEKQTDSRRYLQAAATTSQLNIVGKVSGPGSTQIAGLLLDGPYEETNKTSQGLSPGPRENCALLSVVGSDLLMAGPDLDKGPGEELGQNVHSQAEDRFVPKKSSHRTWKQLARAQSTVLPVSNQAGKFRNLQTVSTKGTPCSKGISSSSTSQSKFNLVGKRSGLGKFKNSIQFAAHKRGTLSSSLKRWEIQFGKRKLCVGAATESDSPKIEKDSGVDLVEV